MERLELDVRDCTMRYTWFRVEQLAVSPSVILNENSIKD